MISKVIKRKAAELGFDACAIAKAEEIDPDNRFLAWLDAGFHADMEWMAHTADMRREPREKLPGAKSAVVAARNYYYPRPPAPLGSGRVSRYAWGRDYHRVLRKPLQALAQAIEQSSPGAQTYCSIDSAPVLEKFWAARAGLGWIGKNSLILHPDLGSWFFLGVILTTAELAPDSPMPDRCGSCRACMDACPTGAIVEPRMVDSRRCISYHTIENRSEIPGLVAGNMRDWVFGCDICQEACPWNHRVSDTDESDFAPRPGHAHPDLERLTRMDAEGFQEAFAGSPIMRAKQAGMARNARIVLHNMPPSGT